MKNRIPCYRHPRDVWIAGCADCTAWHLAVVIARRDARADGSATVVRHAA